MPGLGGSPGHIEQGKLADMVICKRDPIQDIRVLEDVDNISLVMQDGRILKQQNPIS